MTKRASLLLLLPLALAGCAVDGPTTTATPAAQSATSATSAGSSASAARTSAAAAPSSAASASAAASGATSAAAPASTAASTLAATTAAGKTVSCTYKADAKPARPVDPPSGKDVAASGTVTFTLAMTEGPIAITMNRAATPCTVNSFEALAKQKFFDDTQCHRLTDQGIFVLQCGDPTGLGTGGPGYRFADELTGKETYPAGTVAMANAGPNTNGSQFFLVYQDSPLPAKYTVLGTMDAAGLGVVKRIAAMGHTGNPGDGKPINDARIKTVTAG